MRKVAAPLLVPALLAGLTACGPGPVNLEPAEDAANPACAKAMVAMPSELNSLQQRETTAQATTAWGDPSSIILKCGVAHSQEPVSDPCVNVNGIDWIVTPTDPQAAQASEQTASGTWQAKTFGRDPAIRVTFQAEQVFSSTLLAELSSAVAQIPQEQACSNLEDSLSNLPAGS